MGEERSEAQIRGPTEGLNGVNSMSVNSVVNYSAWLAAGKILYTKFGSCLSARPQSMKRAASTGIRLSVERLFIFLVTDEGNEEHGGISEKGKIFKVIGLKEGTGVIADRAHQNMRVGISLVLPLVEQCSLFSPD